MSQATTPPWHLRRTDESRLVETTLRQEFSETDACRFNRASIRVRVIDSRFHAMKRFQRVDQVGSFIEKLPNVIQGPLLNLLLFTPDEIEHASGRLGMVADSNNFEDPDSLEN